jgi:hypothetical protein
MGRGISIQSADPALPGDPADHKALNLAALRPYCPDRAVEGFASVAHDALDASDGASVTAACYRLVLTSAQRLPVTFAHIEPPPLSLEYRSAPKGVAASGCPETSPFRLYEEGPRVK